MLPGSFKFTWCNTGTKCVGRSLGYILSINQLINQSINQSSLWIYIFYHSVSCCLRACRQPQQWQQATVREWCLFLPSPIYWYVFSETTACTEGQGKLHIITGVPLVNHCMYISYHMDTQTLSADLPIVKPARTRQNSSHSFEALQGQALHKTVRCVSYWLHSTRGGVIRYTTMITEQ